MLRLRWRVPVPVLALVVTGSLLSYRAPVSSQQLRIARLKNSVEIIRDHWGVPHIYARTRTICSLRNAKSQHHRAEPAVSDRPLEGSCRISFARHNSSWVSADIDLYVRADWNNAFSPKKDGTRNPPQSALILWPNPEGMVFRQPFVRLLAAGSSNFRDHQVAASLKEPHEDACAAFILAQMVSEAAEVNYARRGSRSCRLSCFNAEVSALFSACRCFASVHSHALKAPFASAKLRRKGTKSAAMLIKWSFRDP